MVVPKKQPTRSWTTTASADIKKNVTNLIIKRKWPRFPKRQRQLFGLYANGASDFSDRRRGRNRSIALLSGSVVTAVLRQSWLVPSESFVFIDDGRTGGRTAFLLSTDDDDDDDAADEEKTPFNLAQQQQQS